MSKRSGKYVVSPLSDLPYGEIPEADIKLPDADNLGHRTESYQSAITPRSINNDSDDEPSAPVFGGLTANYDSDEDEEPPKIPMQGSRTRVKSASSDPDLRTAVEKSPFANPRARQPSIPPLAASNALPSNTSNKLSPNSDRRRKKRKSRSSRGSGGRKRTSSTKSGDSERDELVDELAELPSFGARSRRSVSMGARPIRNSKDEKPTRSISETPAALSHGSTEELAKRLSVHESRHSLAHDNRAMSLHTKSILSAHGDEAPRLVRWRSLEEMDLVSVSGDSHRIISGKRSLAHIASHLHMSGAVSSHSESSTESEGSMSSSDAADELLEAEIEGYLNDEDLEIGEERGAARKMHELNHMRRESMRIGLPPPKALNIELNPIEPVHTRQVLHDIRSNIREMLLLADMVQNVQPTASKHIRITAHRLMEDFVKLKPMLFKAKETETQSRMGKLAGLRSQMRNRRGRIRTMSTRSLNLDDDMPKDVEASLGTIPEPGDNGGDESRISVKSKYPKWEKFQQIWPWKLLIVSVFVLVIMLVTGHRQPHGIQDEVSHMHFTSNVADPNYISYLGLDQDQEMDWLEIHVGHAEASSDHGGSGNAEAVLFWFERLVAGNWTRVSDRVDRCKQSTTAPRKCIFEDYDFSGENPDHFRYRYALEMIDSNITKYHDIAFELQIFQMGPIGHAKIYISFIVLIVVLVLIATDAIHRTLVAFAGALCVVGLLLWCHLMPPFQDVVVWLDEGTLALLFGMMIIVGKLAETGIFEVCTKHVVKIAGRSLFKLTALLCIFTAIMSAFLDNVTTIMLLAPVTIELCAALQIDPVPLLIAETLFSNIGGTATLIGDPPNIIVGSALSYEIGFVDFLANMLPAVCIMFFPLLALLKWQYGDKLSMDLVHQPEAVKESAKHTITDMLLLKQTLTVLFAVIFCFMTHSVHEINPAWIAVLGAIALMIATEPHDIEHALHSVEWDTLLFFAALFVMVEGMAELGMIRTIADGLTSIIETAEEDDQLMVALIVLVWVSAITSSFLDNIPYTTTMVPVIEQMADVESGLGLPIAPLAWALCLGACLGGNGTLIGASANIVCSSIASSRGHDMRFYPFFKIAFPFMLLSVFIAMIYLILRYGL